MKYTQLIDGKRIEISKAKYDALFPDIPVEEEIEQRLVEAKAECRTRILAVMNETAQSAMTATAAATLFDEVQMSLYREGLQWINDMRSTWPELAKDRRKSIDSDKHWPKPSKALLDFVSGF
ncbi:hypothetical protein [Maritalea porphyrae]|uniref:hypothetical protein n=1 Tax=Maritalea porphyrae TaxID=880732 RepID=UPI0022AE8D26|nr:hypothetical protein [Maritalea porphyrae]MCZ4270892.1 hypothetical protein [Maritalea porphyrae]